MAGRKHKVLWIVLGVLAALIVGIVVFFKIPYSPTRTDYGRVTGERIAAAEAETGNAKPSETGELFTEAEITHLPEPVQRYFHYSGWLGKSKMLYMGAELQGVDFVMSETQTLPIDYEQLNFVNRPERYALISAAMFGIPFEGFDSFNGEEGSMKGLLAKVIPLFDQRGSNMTRAGLVTWLAESLLLPSAALQDFVSWESVSRESVSWESVNAEQARATINWNGLTASGVFTFAESGELQSFRTSDRVATDMNGAETVADWSEVFSDFHEVDGVMLPSIIQTIWHYADGDLIYFNEGREPVDIWYR